MNVEIEVYKRDDGLWDWRMRARNGEIIATSASQGYTERNDAVEGATRVVVAAAADDIVWHVGNDLRPTKPGRDV